MTEVVGSYDVGHVHTILGSHIILNNLLKVTRNQGENKINIVILLSNKLIFDNKGKKMNSGIFKQLNVIYFKIFQVIC